MKRNEYTPRPKETSEVQLPEELLPLMEQLARNVHEVWAAGRLADGWRLGPERNDLKREHPCLIPYEELSEEERDYDRSTATQTLKFILQSGFKILPNEK